MSKIIHFIGLDVHKESVAPSIAPGDSTEVRFYGTLGGNYFGDLYRRWKARLGNPKAVTAMAHKLARVLWHLLKYKEAFDWKVFEKEEAKMKRKKLARLQNMTASLNLQLIPLQ